MMCIKLNMKVMGMCGKITYMTNIEFNENSQLNAIKQKVMVGQTEDSGIIGFMTRIGIVKNAQTAHIILLVVAIICFALTVYIFKNSSSPKLEAVPVETQV